MIYSWTRTYSVNPTVYTPTNETNLKKIIRKNKKTVYSKTVWYMASIIIQIIPDFIFQKFKF